MLIRIALALIAMLVSAPCAAQEQNPVTVKEWREILTGNLTDDDNLLRLATSYSNESTALLRSGDRPAGLRKSLVSLVLTKHVHDRKERMGGRVERSAIDSVNGLQTAMLEAGVPQGLMRQTAANLGSALGEISTAMVIKERPTPRPATMAERKAMMAVIKSKLIDPTSPIFGRADVVGNQACFTVNAKNRFGGYTGNQEAVLEFNPKTKAWTGGTMINYPHGVCLDAAR